MILSNKTSKAEKEKNKMRSKFMVNMWTGNKANFKCGSQRKRFWLVMRRTLKSIPSYREMRAMMMMIIRGSPFLIPLHYVPECANLMQTLGSPF